MTGAEISPDSRLVSVVFENEIQIWQLSNLSKIHSFSGYIVPVVTFSANNQALAIADCGRFQLRDVATGNIVQETKALSSDNCFKVLQSRNTDLYYIWDEFGIYQWDIVNSKIASLHDRTSEDGCTPGDISHDGRTLVTIFGNQVVTLDSNTGQILQRYEGHTQQVISVVFSPDGNQILTGSWDGTVRRWDTKTGKEIQRFSL